MVDFIGILLQKNERVNLRICPFYYERSYKKIIVEGKDKMRKGILCLLVVFLLMIPVIQAEAVEVSENNAQFEYRFESVIEGEDISTQSDGKSKVLIFFSTECSHCKNVLRNLASSEWVKKGELADVYAIAGNTTEAEEVEKFQEAYCSGAEGMIKFGFGMYANRAMSDYADAAVDAGGSVGGTPLIAMVDAENRLRYVTSGAAAADGIEEKLMTMESDPDDTQKPGDSQEPGDTGNPDDTKKPGDIENPDGMQKPGDIENPGNSQRPEIPEESSGEGENGSSGSGCSHVVETVWISEATATSDAKAVYRCVKCGATLGYGEVANSAYTTFLKETADAILNAQQESVVIDTKIWVSFSRSVFEALRSRPDVAVTVNYYYEGQPYVLQIPAGTDVDLLMDENGFGGFRYIEKVLNMKN